MKVTAHVAQNNTNRRSAINGFNAPNLEQDGYLGKIRTLKCTRRSNPEVAADRTGSD